MPKVFLTGSGVTRGYITGSGFVSLPPRYLIRQLDSATGSYPTILRTGDRDRTGKYNISFNDKFTQIFGKKFVDEFDNYGLGSETSFDPKRWKASSGMRVRREIKQSKRGSISSDRVLVFGFTTNSLGRWIQTTETYRNPVIKFSLIQGPLESTVGNLKLVQGQPTDTLKIQASNDGINWVDIKTFTPQKNQQTFYKNRNADLKEENYKEAFRSNQVLYRGDFSNISGDFYIRWIQEENLRTRKPAAVWAISRIEIEDLSSQNINAPLMIDGLSTAGAKAHSNAVASPNIIPQLQVTGRVLKGVSDSHITFTPGEEISPFDEKIAIEDYNKGFYSTGLNPEVYPGFNQPTRDKTKIFISLSSKDTESEPKSFGMNSPVTTADPNDETGTGVQTLMVYFNNSAKRWYNYVGFDQLDFNASVKSDVEDYVKSAQGLGFGPINSVATASVAGNITKQFGSNVLSNFVRPTKTTGFPFAREFEIIDDRTVPMSDYIDHPFLLEKIVVKFSAMFEFASGSSTTENRAQKAFRLSYNKHVPQPGADDPSTRFFDNHQVLIPTFFVLNQKRDQFKSTQTVTVSDPGLLNPSRVANYSVNFNSNSNLDVTPTSRELISYGQITLFASASSGTKLNLYNALEDGLERDLSIDILERNGQTDWDGNEALSEFTGSFTLEMPCRVSPRTNNNQRIQIRQKNVSGGTNRSLFLKDDFGGRGYSIIDVLNRSLVNGNTSLTPGESYIAPGPAVTAEPVVAETVSKDSIDQDSPYILFPEDRLIFGWQYPAPELARSLPGSGDTKFNMMKLYGETQIFFYGSLLKHNKETHNTLNQNLTSNAVHEIVGAEKVLDQFQTNTRHEFTGSFIDQVNYYRSVGASDEIQPIDSFVAGTPYQRDPVSRVSIFDDAGRRYEVGSSTNIYSFGGSTPDNDVSIALASSLFRGFNLKSERRIADANKVSEAYWFDYGTYQNFKNSDTDGGPNVYKNSKVYYNYQHFGHFRDMFEQERDTRFGLGFPSAISIESPVVVQFVSASVDVKKLSLKDFKIQSPSQISSDSNTQSSNMSLNSTSSLPFFDDMTARNR